ATVRTHVCGGGGRSWLNPGASSGTCGKTDQGESIHLQVGPLLYIITLHSAQYFAQIGGVSMAKIRITDLAEDVGLAGRTIRQVLRKAGLKAPETGNEGFGPRARYEWTEGSEELEQVRSILQEFASKGNANRARIKQDVELEEEDEELEQEEEDDEEDGE